MEAPSNRVLALAGAALGVTVAVALLVLVQGSDGVAGIPSDPSEAFEDAPERFHVDTDDATERTHTFEVPPGTSVMTVSRSMVFPGNGAWRLLDPDGDQVKSVDLTGVPYVTSFEEPMSEGVIHRPHPGTWRMDVECLAGCTYTLAVYLEDAVSSPGTSLGLDVAGHEITVPIQHDAAVSSQETFDVPAGTRALDFRFSFYSADGGSFSIHDPTGERLTRWSVDAEWTARQAAYTLAENPRPGTWTIDYACSDGCEAAWGFTPVRSPEEG